jgi:hypothetical protein
MPVKKWFGLFGLLLAALLLVFWLKAPVDPPPRAVAGLPWQVEVLEDGGSRVFGLELGRDTLGDVLARLGPDMELAIIVAGDGPESLEMYYSRHVAGMLTGKLVLSGELDAATLARLRERSGLPRYLDSGARKYHLRTEDLPQAHAAPLKGIAFIPDARLDEDIAIRRFGPPGEIIRRDATTVHLLYPHLGLDLMLNEGYRDVLQYVAPRDFERLRAPLLE